MSESGSKVRLQDVAEASGVAVSTVSRVFTAPERVAPATVEAVLGAAQRLGYRRSVGRDRSQTVAVVLQDIVNPYLSALATGIERHLRAAGWGMLLFLTEDSPDLERALLRDARTRADGCIIAGRHASDDELAGAAAATPFVLFNREVAGVSSVTVHTASGDRQIIEHLASLGHRGAVYAAGPAHFWSERQRWEGLRVAADAMGFALDRVGPYLPSLEQGAVAADAAMACAPTAIIAFNDQIAIGAINRLRALGVDVPGQVSVVGYDDSFAATICHPPLTSVSGAAEQAGRLTADTLLTLLSGGEPGTQHRVEASLVLRASTAHA